MYLSIIKAVSSVTTNVRQSSSNFIAEKNAEVALWTTKTKNSIDSNNTSIFDENFGEDRLSSTSTYDVSIKSSCDIPLIGPTRKLLQALVTDEI
jgi:hypothetical protein